MNSKIANWFARARVIAWRRIFQLRYRAFLWAGRHGWKAAIVAMLMLIAASYVFLPHLQSLIGSTLATKLAIEELQALFLTLGGALTAASAIVFSLIVFSIQVNVDRLPHRLFQKLGFDMGLIGAFIVTFIMSVSITSLPLFFKAMGFGVGPMILSGIWGITLITFIFIYAYRRTLKLINPWQQIGIVLRDAQKSCRFWKRQAAREVPVIAANADLDDDVSHDAARIAFFKIHPNWTEGLLKAVEHVIAISKHTAEIGDHEVSQGALGALVSINELYIDAKQKTFFAPNLLVTNPLVTDGFVNECLEQLRQCLQSAISRGDEKQTELVFEAMASLASVYMDIDYSRKNASKTHAHLAVGYLARGVKSAIAIKSPDVLMEGVRLIGRSARVQVAKGKPEDVPMQTKELVQIGYTGFANDDFSPVLQTVIEQLRDITFDLIVYRDRPIRHVYGRIQQDILGIAKFLLETPDTPLTSRHSAALGAYYSVTNGQALLISIKALINGLGNQDLGDDVRRVLIENVAQWAEENERGTKELLLLAIEKRSHLAFDLLHWIVEISTALMALANVESNSKKESEKLQSIANWYLSAMSFIPHDNDTVAFVENFQLTELMFEASVEAFNRDCPEASETSKQMLFDWAFEAGRHLLGWAILERSVNALVVISMHLNPDEQCEHLKGALRNRLQKNEVPAEIRTRTARELRRQAALHPRNYSSSRIEYSLSQIDREDVVNHLNDIADILSPETAGEKVDIGFF